MGQKSLYQHPETLLLSESEKKELCTRLNHLLIVERKNHSCWNIPDEPLASTPFNEQWLTFRSLVNIREPWPATLELLELQDKLLQAVIAERKIVSLNQCEQTKQHVSDNHLPRLYHWQGDITSLATDAIVNAANSGMTGCWQPLHYCIDNAIHTFAGIQLRLACADLMQKQGHPEPTAQAKVTDAFNLPAKHIIHTVGPIANGNPTALHREQLFQCYQACLDAAHNMGDTSIAVCCISTGVFGFPQKEASKIAFESVGDWLLHHPEASMDVVFNTFLDEDARIYREILQI